MAGRITRLGVACAGLTLALALGPAGGFAAPGPEQVSAAAETKVENTVAVRLKGRDFVRLGELKTLTGTLKQARGEWYLVVDGRDHELHLGDHEYRARIGVRLEAGKTVTVKGFVHRQAGLEQVDVAVCTVTLEGREFRFRQDDGSPLWRGRSSGSGAGEGARDGARRGGGAGGR